MQYSETYILGIKEGRAFLNHNPALTVQEMQACLDNCKRCIPRFSQPMKDVFIGERDFWTNQIKLKG